MRTCCTSISTTAPGIGDWWPYPPEDTFYDLDGSRSISTAYGPQAPTVILVAGLGDDWLRWPKAQPALSQLARVCSRVCSYDRAGSGASDSPSGERDSIHIAGELH